jgi:hypothetical protein
VGGREQNAFMAKERGGGRTSNLREHPVPTEATFKRLYAKALWCAKPGCGEPLYKRWELNT